MSDGPRGLKLQADLRLTLGSLALHFRLATDVDALAVIGPSGAGKSTLLRLLAGLPPRGQGRLSLRGETWQDDERGLFVPVWRRRVGWVPQDAALFPHHTVRENLAWTGPDPERLTRVAQVLEIEPLLGRRPRNLSGGERQRVALGRAILSVPRLLLLDEPFAAVDRPLRARLAEEVGLLCREARIPLILVSHDEGDVSRMADEIWELSGGGLRRPA